MTRLYTDDAELYDIAFDWDISAEVDWLVDRLQAASVLEPGCGSGRMLAALADRGIDVARHREVDEQERSTLARRQRALDVVPPDDRFTCARRRHDDVRVRELVLDRVERQRLRAEAGGERQRQRRLPAGGGAGQNDERRVERFGHILL